MNDSNESLLRGEREWLQKGGNPVTTLTEARGNIESGDPKRVELGLAQLDLLIELRLLEKAQDAVPDSFEEAQEE